ncbi:putative S-adenosylmethionine-dependent methyltransferase [Aspergillus tubingensis]|uniref:putative S-adenosylmethionine-dependent methyltransferase n=1 Tax=Aspergillus tubingensis TaxID=5068 RepID=UPI001577F4EE|nr:S-adenosylmethionine-dependent methyltransferase [Aspergillus tubingensis]GFN17757.1 S-adenosylmethionine-dependent methyltransferase [Aspergillus tubingensis]
MADDSHPAHLSPSELGTKDYWETFYARTLSHLSTKHTTTNTTTTKPNPNPNAESSSEESEEDDIDDDSDPGTSWFSEHNAPDKVLQFLTDEEFPLAPVNTNTNNSKDGDEQQAPSILDLGTGNGSMLALLRKRGGYKGVMVGIDYSIRSVQLARELQRLRIHSAYLSDSDEESDSDEGDEGVKEGNGEGGDTNIRFEEWDILHGDVYQTSTTTSEEEGSDGKGGKKGKVDWFPYDKGGFDIVLDKGTFDAVSLSDEVIPASDGAAEGHASGKTVQRRVCERYPGIVRGLVRKGGFVVVTSCNWTEEELVAWFTRADSTSSGGDGEEDKFVVWGRVEYPRFRFGGREGQGVCTVCFQRV